MYALWVTWVYIYSLMQKTFAEYARILIPEKSWEKA